jgi:2,5-diketo-D-gluconate reductase A
LGHNREPLRRDDHPQTARSTAQIIVRWHMQHGRIAIPKSGHVGRMHENINMFDFELSAEDIAPIDALDTGPGGCVGPNPDTYERF